MQDMTDKALADALVAAETAGDNDTAVEAINEIADRLDLDPDETEQGLTPYASRKVDEWVTIAQGAGAMCQRCAANGRTRVPATTRQEYRDAGDYPHWPNRVTDRCDTCAQDLREYAALPSISLAILIDEPLEGVS